MVSQEFPLVGQLSVAENLLLGQRPSGSRVLVDWRAIDEAARRCSQRVGLDVPLRRRVDSLSVAQRQLIEIAKALGRDPHVLILDEPTSALGPTESDRVLEIARGHAAAGGIVIFVGHRLQRGPSRSPTGSSCSATAVWSPTWRRTVATEERIVREMVGRELAQAAEIERPEVDVPSVFEASGLEAEGLGPLDLSRRCRRGRRRRRTDGLGPQPPAARADGRDPSDRRCRCCSPVSAYRPRDTADAVHAGVALVPEDRKVQGLLVDSSLRWNGTLAVLRRIAWRGFVLCATSRPRQEAERSSIRRASSTRRPSSRRGRCPAVTSSV